MIYVHLIKNNLSNNIETTPLLTTTNNNFNKLEAILSETMEQMNPMLNLLTTVIAKLADGTTQI